MITCILFVVKLIGGFSVKRILTGVFGIVLAGCVFGQGVTDMLWADTTRLGKTFSKDPCVVRFKDRYLMYFSLPPFDSILLAPSNAPKGGQSASRKARTSRTGRRSQSSGRDRRATEMGSVRRVRWCSKPYPSFLSDLRQRT